MRRKIAEEAISAYCNYCYIYAGSFIENSLRIVVIKLGEVVFTKLLYEGTLIVRFEQKQTSVSVHEEI